MSNKVPGVDAAGRGTPTLRTVALFDIKYLLRKPPFQTQIFPEALTSEGN